LERKFVDPGPLGPMARRQKGWRKVVKLVFEAPTVSEFNRNRAAGLVSPAVHLSE